MHWTSEVAQWLAGFMSRHSEGLTLLVLAFVATMREQLPSPLNRIEMLVWLYDWVHDALKTLVNLRTPKPPNG